MLRLFAIQRKKSAAFTGARFLGDVTGPPYSDPPLPCRPRIDAKSRRAAHIVRKHARNMGPAMSGQIDDASASRGAGFPARPPSFSSAPLRTSV